MILVSIYLYKPDQDHRIPFDTHMLTFKGKLGFRVVFPPSDNITVAFKTIQISISHVLLVTRPNRL